MRNITAGILIAFSCAVMAGNKGKVATCEAEKSINAADSAAIISGKDYSGGKAVSLKKGKKLKPVEMRNPHKPALIFKYQLPKGGDYQLVIKGYSPNEGTDSFYYSLNGGRLFFAATRPGRKFVKKYRQRLSGGKNSLEIYSRENGCIIDCLNVYVAPHRRSKGKLKMPDWPAPPITPPATRPRVLLNPDFIKVLQLRIAARPEYKTALERIEEAAKKKNAGKLGSKKMFASAAAKEIRCQAFLYAVKGAKAEGELAVKNLLTMLKTVKFEKRQDVCRSYGELMYTAACVYDWCYPLLSGADRKTVVAGIMKWAPKMEIGWPPVRQSDITSHAGEAQLLRDLLSAGIAVYDSDPKIYDYSARRFFAGMVPAREFFFKSHRHHQGDSYGTYRFSWAVWAAVIFERMSGKLVFSENMGKVPYFFIYARLPDGQTLRDGDTTKTGNMWVAPLRHMAIAGLYKDPYVKQVSIFEGANDFARTAPLKFMLFNNPDVKPRLHSELPLTKYFPEPLGSIIARTGWQTGPDSSAAIVEMKGAGYQFTNHQHLDAGAFQIYYKGYLATDAGAYSGLKYGTPFDWSYNKRTIAHNAMLAYDPVETFARGDNDGGQRQPNNLREPKTLEALLKKGYRNGSILTHDFGPDKIRPFYSYLDVDLKLAYKKDKLTGYTRTFCFLNFGNPDRAGALIVLDRMSCAKPETRKIWLLQSLFKPEVNADTITVTRTDGSNSGKLVDNILLPEKNNIKFEVIGGPGKENYVFGRNYPIPRHSDLSNGWRTQISPVKAAKTDTFLNVLQIMDAKLKPLKVEKISTADLLGVIINDRIVTFPAISTLSKSFELKLPNSGKMAQVLLTGLKSGKWNIGNRFTVNVKAEAGTAFFVVKADGSTLRIKLDPKSKLPVKAFDIAPPAEKELGPRLIVNHKRYPISSMFKQKKCVWVPAMTAFKAAGAEVQFNKGVLNVKYKGRKLRIKQDTHRLFINGVKHYLRMPAPLVKGELYLPVSNIASFLMLKPVVFFEAKCILLQNFPPERSTYPWYEKIKTNCPNSAHPVENACDGDLLTYWAGRGKNCFVSFDLGRIMDIGGIRIAWYKGTDRKAIFSVEVSDDGKKWSPVYKGMASGKTDKFESYKVKPCKARYVKIVGQGNTTNDFNSILEAAVILRK